MDHTILAPLAGSIQSLVQQDPGNRGLAVWATKDRLLPAALSLSLGNHCLICTGFFIPGANAIETDGPLGAVVLSQVLANLGREVTILTDRHAEMVMGAALDSVGTAARLLTFSHDDPMDYAEIITTDTTHLIAIERPGLAADGYHHNIRGDIISEHVAPFDSLFIEASRKGLATIGIGDGGNELGMGNVAQAADCFASPGQPYACVIASDFCICAGVSNWGAYALSGLLSVIHGANHLLNPVALSGTLDNIVKAGAVDGVTGARTPTVDSLPRTWEDEVYGVVYRLVKEHIALESCKE